MSSVPYLDLKRQHHELRSEILDAITSAVDEAGFVGGLRVAAFERAFAEYCGAGECIGVANGTDAITVALRAAGVGHGDEVIVPAYTFVATAGAVVACGARPVLADVSPTSALVDPEAVAARVTPRTRAVVPVHLYGLPCDIPALRTAVDAAPHREGRIVIVEDCAQAHGAAREGVVVGAMADAGAFSFYPTKNLGTMGDGGAVTTSDGDLARLVREIADHGRPSAPDRRNEHVRPGVNSRLDALQAAVLSIKLRRLPDWNVQRAVAAAQYRSLLLDRTDVTLQDLPEGVTHAWYIFALRHARRDELIAALERHGVQARAVYPRAVHEYPAYSGLGDRRGDHPGAEAWAREVVTLPMFASMTADEVERVLSALTRALDEVRPARVAMA